MQKKTRLQPLVCLENDKIIGYEALYQKNADERYPNATKMLDNIFSVGISNLDSQLFINMNPEDVSDKNFCDEILNVLEKWNIDAEKIVLEINESTPPSVLKDAKKYLDILRSYNLKIALDDFGTEYSNIFYMSELPVDIIKIDKKFVQDAPCNQKLRTLLKYCVAISHDFGCQVVAEGIENSEQLECMTESQVDIGQGFFFSAPSLSTYQNSPFTSLEDFVRYMAAKKISIPRTTPNFSGGFLSFSVQM